MLAAFKKHRQTMALLVNEYGDLQGLVTLHDVLEALVGDIGRKTKTRTRTSSAAKTARG